MTSPDGAAPTERITTLYKRVEQLSAELDSVRAEVRSLVQSRDEHAAGLADLRADVRKLADQIGSGSWWTRVLVVGVPAIVEGLRQAGVLH